MGLARFIVRHFDRSLSSPCRLETRDAAGIWVPLSRKELGELGERLAARYLTREGCKVLYRNYRAPQGGELDLVCRHGEVLVFVEVKTRTSTDFGTPGQAVDAEKQRLIVRGAQSWLRRLDQRDVLYRFDIVEVTLKDGEVPQINWLENAFQLPKQFHA